MNEFEKRQLNTICRMLDLFDKKQIKLDVLVTKLDGLLNSMDATEGDWKKSFLKQIGALEDVYATATDRNIKDFPSEYVALIENSIGEIRRLISEKI